MNPVRLSRRGSPFDQRLLGAARAEVPAEGAEDRALALLGLSGFLAPAAPVPSPGVQSLVRGWPLKGIGALMAVLAGGAVAVLSGRSPVAHVLPAVVTPVTAGTPVSPLFAAPSSTPQSPPTPARLAAKPPPPARSPRPVTSSAPPAPSTPEPSALSAELALVQQATQALARRDPDAALSILSSYASRYPHGILAAEAGYLRVRSLLAEGDRGAAMDLAGRLLAADPHGVLAPKLEALIASEPIP